MTTIACNLKEMAADSLCFTHSEDEYFACKLHRIGGSIFAEAGEQCELIIDWLQRGAPAKDRPSFTYEDDDNVDPEVIELAPSGIYRYGRELVREKLIGRVYASGSGRSVALYCMRYRGMTPAQAVREACRVDRFSSAPVYRASLATGVIHRWHPERKARSSGAGERRT